jgi:hypothetical protein
MVGDIAPHGVVYGWGGGRTPGTGGFIGRSPLATSTPDIPGREGPGMLDVAGQLSGWALEAEEGQRIDTGGCSGRCVETCGEGVACDLVGQQGVEGCVANAEGIGTDAAVAPLERAERGCMCTTPS